MNKKLYVRNISFNGDEPQLEEFFKSQGFNVVSVRIPRERETGRSRGFGFVELATSEEAERAINTLNGKEFVNRPLAISEAREQEPRAGGGPRPGGFGGGARSSSGPRPGGFGGAPRGPAGGGDGGYGPPPGFEGEGGGARPRRERNKDRDRRRGGGNDDNW